MFEGKKVIDVHGHMTTPPEFRGALANMVSQNTAPRKFEISDERLEAAQKRHLDMLDDHNVDFQLLSPRPIAMWHWLRPHLQFAWCRFTNDTIAKIVKLHPDRFAGVAQLPQNRELNTSHLVEELERAVKELGFVGALVNPDPGGDKQTPGMNDEYWFPLYEKAQALSAVLMVHPSVSFDRRLEAIPSNYQINNVQEEYIAMQLLEHSNVFEVFPKLKMFVCHCGGALHRFIPTDHHVGQRDLTKNLWFDSCVLDAPMLAAGIKQKGPKRILFGTEAPGSGGAIRPENGLRSDNLVPVIDSFEFLSKDDKLNIFHNNAFDAVPLLPKTGVAG